MPVKKQPKLDLQNRVEDISLLAEHFIEQFARRLGRKRPRLTLANVQQLQHYPWPGNIRELQHLQAVLVEVNGGATTSFGYEVSIVPSGSQETGQPAVRLYGAVRNDQAYGANLRWASASQLNVEFMQARDAKLELPALTVSGRRVSLALQSGITDPNAPPGGMLYNLRGAK